MAARGWDHAGCPAFPGPEPQLLAWPLPLRVLPGLLGDLAIDLIAQVVDFTLCPAQGCGLVAENTFRGSLDALSQLVDTLAGARAGGLGRLVGDAGVEQRLVTLSVSGIVCSSALRTVSNRLLASRGSVSSAS